jgi:DNA-binding transcriptional MocR family regulator
MSRLTPSLVREILAAATNSDMISFAGGLPATDLMPPLPLGAIGDATLNQYGATEGEPAYRNAVAEWIGETGLIVAPSQILPLSGSQQGLDLAAKLLIDPGTAILTEAPTYIAALQVFRLFGADIYTTALHEEGPVLDELERNLDECRPRCIYLIPTFQNPTGTCYSLEARRAVADLLDHYGTFLIEDDPYRTVSLDVAKTPIPVSALLKRAPWIYLGSFSKILWPGWRLGYLAAREDLMPHLVSLKQALDLHTQRPGQMAVSHWLNSRERESDIERLRTGYRLRRDAMQKALTNHFGDIAQWQEPKGGLFFWIRLREHQATRALLAEAMEAGVAFMPGETFYADTPSREHIRLNYSHATPEQMDHGLALLSKMLRHDAA